jgi:peptidoglycan/LPS O-acetylase OafA/YrhL
LPLYYVVLVPYFALMAGGGTPRDWLLFATFSENFSPATIEAVNPVLWSLVIELHFYAVLPLLALLLTRLARGSLRGAMWAIVVLGLASFALRWLTFYADPTPNPQLRYSLPSCFMFFAPGMALALLRLACERSPTRLPAGPLARPELWLGGALVAWLPVAYVDRGGFFAALASFLLVGALVLPLRDSRVARALEWRPLAAVGVASYSLNLWHVLILRKFAEHVGLDQFGWLLAVAAPVCIAVAFASYAIVERPFLRLRRRWGSTAAGTRATATG